MTKTCPICKQRGFQYETRRLYFSSDNNPSEREERIAKKIKQTKTDIEVARAMCFELQDLLASSEDNREKFKTLHQKALNDIARKEEENVSLKLTISYWITKFEGLKETHEKKDRRRETEFAATEENINKVHATITKGLHKEIQNYENQLLIAKEEIQKLLEATPEEKSKIVQESKKKPDNAAGSKKEDHAMEQRIKKLEKQVQELQIASKKKQSIEATSSRRRPSRRGSRESTTSNPHMESAPTLRNSTRNTKEK